MVFVVRLLLLQASCKLLLRTEASGGGDTDENYFVQINRRFITEGENANSQSEETDAKVAAFVPSVEDDATTLDEAASLSASVLADAAKITASMSDVAQPKGYKTTSSVSSPAGVEGTKGNATLDDASLAARVLADAAEITASMSDDAQPEDPVDPDAKALADSVLADAAEISKSMAGVSPQMKTESAPSDAAGVVESLEEEEAEFRKKLDAQEAAASVDGASEEQRLSQIGEQKEAVSGQIAKLGTVVQEGERALTQVESQVDVVSKEIEAKHDALNATASEEAGLQEKVSNLSAELAAIDEALIKNNQTTQEQATLETSLGKQLEGEQQQRDKIAQEVADIQQAKQQKAQEVQVARDLTAAAKKSAEFALVNTTSVGKVVQEKAKVVALDQRQIDNLVKEENDIAEKLAEADHRLADIVAKVEQLTTAMELSRQAQQRISVERLEKEKLLAGKQAASSSVLEDVVRSQNELKTLRSEKHVTAKQISEKEEEVQTLERTLLEADEVQHKLQEFKKSQLQGDVEMLKTELSASDTLVQAKITQVSSLSGQFKAISAEHEDMVRAVNNYKAMEEEQAELERNLAARIESIKALVPEIEAAKSEQQFAVDEKAKEIKTVSDQMRAHEHDQQVVQSLYKSLNESFIKFDAEATASLEHLTMLEDDMNRLRMDEIEHENLDLEAAQAMNKLTQKIEETRVAQSRLEEDSQAMASQRDAKVAEKSMVEKHLDEVLASRVMLESEKKENVELLHRLEAQRAAASERLDLSRLQVKDLNDQIPQLDQKADQIQKKVDELKSRAQEKRNALENVWDRFVQVHNEKTQQPAA